MAENEFAVPGDYLKHRFLELTQVEFGLVKGRKIGSKCHGNPWNIPLSNSNKSHFGLVKVSENNLQCLATPWNIVFSNSTKSLFGIIKGQKLVRSTWRTLETFLPWPHTSRILDWKRGKNKFNLPCENLNHPFINFNKVAFDLVKKQKTISKSNAKIWNIDISTLKPRIFDWSRGLK